MAEDKWHIPFFYPSKKTAGLSGKGTGFYWTQNNDITKDDDYDGTAMVRIGKEHDSSDYKVIDSSTGEWQFPFNFDSGDGLSLSGPTGHHSGGETHGCEGFTYMINVSLEDNPPKFRFRKETYHVQYDNHPEGLWTHPVANRRIVGGGWFGYGWVRYNRKDGRGPGKDSVICECWWNNDPEADITKWVMLRRVEDKGDGITNWGVGATCDGQAHQVGTWSNIQFRFKVDASDFSLHPLKPEFDSGPNIHSIGEANMSFADSEARGYGYRIDMPRDVEMKLLFRFNDTSGKCRIKNLSLREIDPFADFTDPTTPPPPTDEPPTTTTVSGTFQFNQNINTIRSSACAGAGTGGGGGSGNTVFYSVDTQGHDTELSNSSTFQNRTKGGEKCVSSASRMHGKVIKQLDVWLKKAGTPAATPKIYAKIWHDDNSVIYLSPTKLDPTTLTTSFARYTFDFSTNTHALTTGDIVGVYYDSTSSSNYVLFGYDDNNIPDCIYTQFEGSSWEDKPTTRDFSAEMWE